MQFSEADFKEGQVLLFDKPLNWTSFQLVNKVRWLIRKTYNIKKIKVGHAGTLDPLATGLMIICTGKFTKRIEEFMGQEKEYTGTIVVGATTPSYDLETEIDATFPTDHLSEEAIHKATAQFTGSIMQQPPIFSALKKDGKRLYEFAREGKNVDIPSREVQVSAFEITRIALPEVDFRISCSKGTYIRSLAHDFGKALNSGGHLSALRRTKIGDFQVKNATDLEAFEAALNASVS
ncbi:MULTISPECIES: tRNA pseudouridine(55) synthase TruB [unclassified Leeuwenhoekiella]|uniref:tRNA pseudouridine(55) synthase TruB n=1 Tax=unclassified Leeuwenhoekiella TaxID=2615029 RepID=UPI000C542414|nr:MULTISPECIES: tRNA pseudouridine(55) synthase TruB [unclassified Leeuwenhoekiella]MAW96804.1 tRNA pseudouridine(55) synthase TruB [Leeuwenhoekiella sp.]MBA82399.1 tRNA pseudouridine(55) synthase TruB [Leeuwenhoekiella sp.]|tara:strand:+ start:5672 stop:6376 length:705 start_codon:yes stop_codon:yes gene_type:complete